MNASIASIRRYLKCIQSCEHIISLSIRYSGTAISGIKVDYIAPYKYVIGRIPQPQKSGAENFENAKFGTAAIWKKLTCSSWLNISF